MQQDRLHSKSKFNQQASTGKGLFRLAGIGIVLTVGLTLLDIGLSVNGGDVKVGGMSAVEWFGYFQSNAFLGLRNLGLFNVLNLTLTIPLYLALYRLHRNTTPAYAALALILFVFGAAVYVANNRSLTMLALSNQYADLSALQETVEVESQRELIAAAGTTILAQGEDFTPGTFPGFFINNAASILMMGVLLRGRLFHPWICLAGLVGSVLMLAFTITVTFFPALFDLVMVLALAGGLLMIVWDSAMAAAMFRIASQSSSQSLYTPAALPNAGKGAEIR